MSAAASIGRGFLGAIFPPACAACDRLGPEPFCRLCADALEPAPAFEVPCCDRALALWFHGGPAALAVHALKYRSRTDLARPLGGAMKAALHDLDPVDVAVPVPLSRKRLTERGYNQARELIRGLAIPNRTRALLRVREGVDQVGLDRAARLANLRGAIVPGPHAVRALRVLLVDDVITTGATAEAAARALFAAGARSVQVLALTRA